MREKTVLLFNTTQTLMEMTRLANQYKEDVRPFAHLNLYQFYFLIQNIPFRPDPFFFESLQRPAALFHGIAEYSDCDCKAISIKAYCNFLGIESRYCAVSYSPNLRLSHIYNEVNVYNEWLPVDATYPENQIFREYPFTRKVIFI